MSIPVTIASITYNEEEYIEDALKSWLSQETDFQYEILVSDDGSTDHTCDIVRSYMEKFPNIRLISTGHIGGAANFIRSLKESRGKYIALCEGDDYWIDNHKIQKQFDFLESHPDFSACFTNSYVLNTITGEKRIAKTRIWDEATTEGLLMHRDDDNVQMSPGHTSTFFFRNQFIKSYPRWWARTKLGDFSIYMLMSRYGKAKFINDITSVYRRRPNGLSSKNYSFVKNAKERIYTYKHINRDFNYKFRRIINPIIADYYFKIGKYQYKNESKISGLWSLFLAFIYNPLFLKANGSSLLDRFSRTIKQK